MKLADTDRAGSQHPNAGTIERLYVALRDRKPEAAAENYASRARFHDIAFDLTDRGEIASMWRFVCSRDIAVTFGEIHADDATGSGRWTVRYTMSGSGRPVCNAIHSTFDFRDGQITKHVDDCNPIVWADQAYAFPMNIVLGRLGLVRRFGAQRKLKRFRAAEKSGRPRTQEARSAR